MPEWLLPILVGIIVVGLIGVIYNSVTRRVSHLEGWKEQRPSITEILTVSKHFEYCKENTKELKIFFKEELRELRIPELRKEVNDVKLMVKKQVEVENDRWNHDSKEKND